MIIITVIVVTVITSYYISYYPLGLLVFWLLEIEWKSPGSYHGPALTGSHWAMLTFPQVTTWCRNCPPKHLENHDKSDAWLTVWGGITWNHLNDMWCCFFWRWRISFFWGLNFWWRHVYRNPLIDIENLQEMDQFGRSFQSTHGPLVRSAAAHQ